MSAMLRQCLLCQTKIELCNGHALARDVAQALAGKLPWTEVRELCPRCLERGKWNPMTWKDPRMNKMTVFMADSKNVQQFCACVGVLLFMVTALLSPLICMTTFFVWIVLCITWHDKAKEKIKRDQPMRWTRDRDSRRHLRRERKGVVSK